MDKLRISRHISSYNY